MSDNIEAAHVTDFEGVFVGNAQDEAALTGCTVILCPQGAICGADIRGGAPATRETDLLEPVNMVEKIHAVILSGGSAYGLDAAGGVMRFLEEKGIGFDVGVGVVPIVCGASLFDLACGNGKIRPDATMGYAACKAAFADEDLEEGNVGAGCGATVGKLFGPSRAMKGGLGIYSIKTGDIKVLAIVAVNALGDIRDHDDAKPLAGLLSEDGKTLISTEAAIVSMASDSVNAFSGDSNSPTNTTIGCVITNAALTKAQAKKVAQIAQNGIARTIFPAHTPNDGDTIFVMSTGEVSADTGAMGIIACKAVGKAINRGVLKAKSAGGYKALCDL
ncbi:MAG: P1 family peptidase [Oligosphaeraceae bacterium]|nr:P1 family peptidase [Oligosphaeraceae bacterium]